MKKYCSPMAEIYDLAKEDIMSASGILSAAGKDEIGDKGGELDFGDFNMTL